MLLAKIISGDFNDIMCSVFIIQWLRMWCAFCVLLLDISCNWGFNSNEHGTVRYRPIKTVTHSLRPWMTGRGGHMMMKMATLRY